MTILIGAMEASSVNWFKASKLWEILAIGQLSAFLWLWVPKWFRILLTEGSLRVDPSIPISRNPFQVFIWDTVLKWTNNSFFNSTNAVKELFLDTTFEHVNDKKKKGRKSESAVPNEGYLGCSVVRNKLYRFNLLIENFYQFGTFF